MIWRFGLGVFFSHMLLSVVEEETSSLESLLSRGNHKIIGYFNSTFQVKLRLFSSLG
jgi:hypothetical protein